MRRHLRRFVVLALVGVVASGDPVAAHVGGLSGGAETGTVPSWLTVGTGGVLVGVSFLFTSFMTDHDLVRRINGLGVSLPALPSVRTVAVWGARVAGVVVLGLVVATGFVGPREPVSNFAILVVWSGWWAGYAMSVYLVGNTWRALNPWRTLALLLPGRGRRSYPDRAGSWPAVVGLLGFVSIEVVSPLAEDARLLAGLVVAYTAVTLVGAWAYGVDTWFERADPVARVFHFYGLVAPFRRTDDGVELGLPVTRLVEYRLADRPGETAFVVGLLWATTFDGLVTTAAWATVVEWPVSAGAPPVLVYLATMVAGFGLFLGVYRLAACKSRAWADSYVTAGFVARWFAPSLVPIAVGYHLAHYLSYFLTLTPVLAAAIASPFTAAANPVVVVLPGWFGIVQMGFVLVGHMLAVWVAHSLAFDLFPGVLQPIRSQYSFVVVMIFYTTVSLWVVVQPFTPPPYT